MAVAELTRAIGAATHSMGWLTWNARHRSKHFTVNDVYSYDKEMHELYPAITAALAVLSAMSEALFRKMEPLVTEVYKLDEQIALAATKFLDEPIEGISLLSNYVDEVKALSEALNSRVADIIRGQGYTLIGAGSIESPNPDANRALQARSSPVSF